MLNRNDILRTLERARIPHKPSRRVITLFCPFHADRATMSLVIYPQTESWFCFGCRRWAPWEELAKTLRLGRVRKDWEDPLAFKHLVEELNLLIRQEPRLPPLVRTWRDGSWRSLTSQTLTQARSLWWWDDVHQVRRIVWPIWNLNQDLAGWVGRDLDNIDRSPRKYYNMPSMEVSSLLWPWPKKLRGDSHWVVLVEGIVDALTLLQAGIPAMATLGTAWNRVKTTMVSNLEVEQVMLAFDPDPAGKEANYKVGKSLLSHFSKQSLAVWEWPEGKDPGDASEETLQELREETGNCKQPHTWLLDTPAPSPDWFSDRSQQSWT